jgi:hypothetical protein
VTAPRGLQLSRRRGFNLQAASIALNGLPAVSVARPGKWGNPWRVGLVACGCRSAGECSHNILRAETVAEAVDLYREWITHGHYLKTILHELRGTNLACWCPLGSPCHRNVLLELANR